jgi:hypothetical protein
MKNGQIVKRISRKYTINIGKESAFIWKGSSRRWPKDVPDISIGDKQKICTSGK